ncbi:MAG TPA: hypothetical protein VJY33_14310 [Isosphaeraceae bacterium]|nr:hypothetical protein [Isosphaeraceae bacterium]
MNEIDEIRRQMAQIRHDLHQDVSNVVSGVSEVVNEVSGVMDWRSALRGHPYMLVGAALAAGYLIVPRRKEVAEPGQNSLASTVVPESLTRKKRFRPVSFAAELLWPIATQAIQAYALIWIENRLKQYLHVGPDGHELDQRYGNEFQRPAPGHLR